MTSHRAPRSWWRRLSGARARALLSLAAVAAVALGLGAQGTFAFFTDKATVNAGGFTAGTLDITVAGALAGTTANPTANNPGTTTLTTPFSLTTMQPGDSQAISFPVGSNGSIGFNYALSGTATGALAPAIGYTIYTGAASNATAANGIRTGTCAGTTALATNQVLSGTSNTLFSGRNLTASGGANASETLCVIAKLSTTADNSLQGAITAATLVLDATQVNAP